jgi:hypothetical protein
MKKLVFVAAMMLISRGANSQAIDPVSLVIAKAIKAIDLKVQRLQNATLVLQFSEQQAADALSKNKLAEIAGWQQQLTELYRQYYVELKTVKRSIAGGSVVRRIFELHQQVLTEYGRMGKNATAKASYDAALENSMEVLQTVQLVTGSALSMKDGDRVGMLQTLKDGMLHCLSTMRTLNEKQRLLMHNETRLKADLDIVKRLHGLQ